MSAIDKKLCILFDEELPSDLFPPTRSITDVLEETKNKKLRWEGSGRLHQQPPNMQNVPRPVATAYFNPTEIDLPRQRMMEAYRSFFLDGTAGSISDFYSSISFRDQER